MLRKTIILKTIIVCLFTSSFIFAVNKITEPKIDKFIDKMVSKHNFDRNELQELLYNAKYHESIIKAMTRPAEKMPWHRYQKIFLQDKRVNQGVKFWAENEATLKRAEKQFGIPPEIIVSLIGVETYYGKNKGSYPVLESLSTLAFHYKPRSRFFTSELEHFLLYSREEQADPKSFYGSYAGAMGYPQFISSSIRSYAVDFTNNGRRDLHNNIDDAIGSVANYLKKHGWVKGQPIIDKADIKDHKNAVVTKYTNKLKPKLTLGKLNKSGVTIKQEYNNDLVTSLLSFEQKSLSKEEASDYWVGFNNFYVITRYNHSQNYALAVYLLSEQIKEKYAPNVKKKLS